LIFLLSFVHNYFQGFDYDVGRP